MKEMVTFSKEDIDNVMILLNSLTLSGTGNFRKLAMVDEMLKSGVPGKIRDEAKKTKSQEEGD